MLVTHLLGTEQLFPSALAVQVTLESRNSLEVSVRHGDRAAFGSSDVGYSQTLARVTLAFLS